MDVWGAEMVLGDVFSAGDVLLEIETDKAHMDVEAQDDGIVAKIMVKLPGISIYPSAFMQLLKNYFLHRSKLVPKSSKSAPALVSSQSRGMISAPSNSRRRTALALALDHSRQAPSRLRKTRPRRSRRTAQLKSSHQQSQPQTHRTSTLLRKPHTHLLHQLRTFSAPTGSPKTTSPEFQQRGLRGDC